MRFSMPNYLKYLYSLFILFAVCVSNASAAYDPNLFSKVTAGVNHTCAVTLKGGVKCWGFNTYGQLGDNSTKTRLVPTALPDLTSGIADVSAGSFHTCALTTGGAVLCWGANYKGQLGEAPPVSPEMPPKGVRTKPGAVTSLTSGIKALASGDSFNCVLTTAGAVKCWGRNNNGQLGNGTQVDSFTPVQVTGLTSGITSISLGSDHACAITASGAAKCWGTNINGVLGYNPPVSRAFEATPVSVINFASGTAALSAGYSFGCAVTNAGGVQCWGYNNHGQKGTGAPIGTQSPFPVIIPGLANIKAITTGGGHGCAINANNGVQCWGYNDEGQVGDNSKVDRFEVKQVVGLTSGITTLASGWKHTCAITDKSKLYCWGNNDAGQIGNNSRKYISSLVPALIRDPANSAVINLLLLN